jgi:hypothetical protein
MQLQLQAKRLGDGLIGDVVVSKGSQYVSGVRCSERALSYVGPMPPEVTTMS